MKYIIAFLFLQNTLAFTFNNTAGAAFGKDTVSVNVASHTCNNLGVTNDELLSLAGEAVYRFWNNVPTSRLTLTQGSIVSVATAFQTGLICQTGTNCTPTEALKVSSDILISCNTNATNFSNSVSVLGVTVPNNITGKTINGALVLVNDQSGNSFQNKSREEKIAILAHEIGHAIGLGHSKHNDQLMHFESIPTRKRLGWDDLNGISWLYPMEQPIGGCGTVDFNQTNHKTGGFLVTFLIGLLIIVGLKIKGSVLS
ncbi:matrixin family metalloprotease [Bacteriovoracaceae bacterium]|nr:matrixin family metalloprotease [Bacteriovoracaceae bacterium]